MNKKEILEIKKFFKPENVVISKICGCYVDYEKEIKLQTKSAFLALPEEEEFKYLDIFKKTLSGGIGKKLLNLSFPLAAEEENGEQSFLLKLRDSHLEDDTLIEEFYNKVISSYAYETNYYIVLIHGLYDVPGKAGDGSTMFDASDEVYDFIMCSICPVDLSKAGLSYNAELNAVEDRIRDWLVGVPMDGFVFPAFNDRSSDIHNMLYYSKKTNALQDDFIREMFGINAPLSADEEKEKIRIVLEDALDKEYNFEFTKNFQEIVFNDITEHSDDKEELQYDVSVLKKILEECNISEDSINAFEDVYENELHGRKVSAKNIIDEKNFVYKNIDVTLKVSNENLGLVSEQMIDGRKCLVIRL